MPAYHMDHCPETLNGTPLQVPQLHLVQDVSRCPSSDSNLTSVPKIINATRMDFSYVSASVQPQRNSLGPMANDSYQIHMTPLSSISQLPAMPGVGGRV
jgi:hypothetical protein